MDLDVADTFTTKLALRQYDPALFYDVSKLSGDMLKIDNAFGTVVCTSTTRPSTGLFDGLTLWETDTKRLVVRVSGAWVPIPQIVIVADATARNALVTKYDGMNIYRQDRDWLEVYDGAAWRVVGTAKGASIADLTSAVTSPYTDQLGTATDINMLCRYDGAAWVGILPLGGTTAAHRRDAQYAQSANQSIPSNSLTTLQFGTARYTTTDVTASGTGNQDFTLNRVGLWRVTASLKLAGGSGAERSIEINNITDTLSISSANAASNIAAVLSCGDEFRISATGKVIRVQAYQATGSNQNTDANFTRVSLTWLRP